MRAVNHQVEYRREQAAIDRAGPPKAKKPNADILEHERKRKIELKIMEFQDEKEEQVRDSAPRVHDSGAFLVVALVH